MSKLQGHVVITRGWFRRLDYVTLNNILFKVQGGVPQLFPVSILLADFPEKKNLPRVCLAKLLFVASRLDVGLGFFRLQLPQHSISPHSTNIRDIRTLIIAVT